jgi:hypothetical protein
VDDDHKYDRQQTINPYRQKDGAKEDKNQFMTKPPAYKAQRRRHGDKHSQ